VLPNYLTQLNLHFDFSHQACTGSGRLPGTTSRIPPGGVCVPDANGCYYTLNGLVNGRRVPRTCVAAVLHLRLAAVRDVAARVLWKGGLYDQESGWVPTIARLQSNQEYTYEGFRFRVWG